MLTTDITGYVALAFQKAGNLVKTLTITGKTRGAFSPITGLYPETTTTFDVEVVDNDDNAQLVGNSNKDKRSYIVKAGTLAQTGQKFQDEGIEWTIFRINRIQQNSVIFVYEMWAEA
jgi:hypothetical protein